MVKFIIESWTEEAMEKFCIEFLTKREWVVQTSRQWETPKEMAGRLNVSASHLSRTMKKKSCPKPSDTARGPTGRILYIKSTLDLDKFISAHVAHKFCKHEP